MGFHAKWNHHLALKNERFIYSKDLYTLKYSPNKLNSAKNNPKSEAGGCLYVMEVIPQTSR